MFAEPLNPEKVDTRLVNAIEASWSAYSSSSELWRPDLNRALGQCVVTACVVQDYYKGRIFRTMAKTPDGYVESHFLNEIAGMFVDLSRKQFLAETDFSEPQPRRCGFASTREYLLSKRPNLLRYIGFAAEVRTLYRR